MESNIKTEKINIPTWMTQEEQYDPVRDHDRFIEKSMLALLGVLSKARNNRSIGAYHASASVCIATSIYLIILSALAQNMFFNYVLLAGLLVWFCILPGEILKKSFMAALTAAVFSAIIMIPAVFMGNPQAMLRIALKVFFSAGLLGGMAGMLPWNEVTAGLRFFHVPDLFVFTFDITLKYIVLLGEISLHMLTALKLRSVGKNPHKGTAMSGVLGVTFLKSREMADEMYDAMTCRGFEGEYRRPREFHLQKTDIFLLILALAATGLFLYTM